MKHLIITRPPTPASWTNYIYQEGLKGKKKKRWTHTHKNVQQWRKLKVYSLGSSEALTHFLHQRFSLPFFGDVGEQLSKHTHTQKIFWNEPQIVQSCRLSAQHTNPPADWRNDSLHDGIEVLWGHASLGVRQATDDVWQQVVDCIVLMGGHKERG